MAVKRVTPKEANELIAKEGYAYLDVRSMPEYAGGHAAGAYNIPLMHKGPGGMSPNARFVAVVGKVFAKDAKIITGCRSGGRSIRAAEQLVRLGYTNVLQMMGGWDGEPGEPGWSQLGLPSEQVTPGKSFEELEQEPGK